MGKLNAFVTYCTKLLNESFWLLWHYDKIVDKVTLSGEKITMFRQRLAHHRFVQKKKLNSFLISGEQDQDDKSNTLDVNVTETRGGCDL